MDINAGRIASGEPPSRTWAGTVPPDARRGQRPQKTWAEQWKLHNALVLFNPAR
jgi:galactarate dehydratase